MGWEYMQSIVQYRFNTETKQTEILKRFVIPVRGSQGNIKKKKAPKALVSEAAEEEYM